MRTRKEQEESQRSLLRFGASNISQDFDEYLRTDMPEENKPT